MFTYQIFQLMFLFPQVDLLIGILMPQYEKLAQKKLPKVPDNVQFEIGLFDQTIPEFLASHADPVAFLHVDCDLYSSTVTIFDAFGPRLQTGAIILFDEYYNFPRWQQHEYKAFQEYVTRSGMRYEYIAYSVTGQQVAIRVLENPTFAEQK